MNLYIAPDRLISEIQKEFNKAFPFLKLEFFTRKALSRSDYSSGQRVRSNLRFADIQLKSREGYLELNGEMKVRELENCLKDTFSLAAQVFRQSGNLWLETTMSDNWTLNQQNDHGKELSTASRPKPDVEDYDLTRDNDN